MILLAETEGPVWKCLLICVFTTHILLEDAFFNQKVSIFFLFLNENICYGYSLEAPHRGTSNEYPQHMFSLRNKKNIYLILLSKPVY